MLNIQPFLLAYAYPLAALVLAGVAAWALGQSGKWLNAHAKFLSAQTKASILAAESNALDEGANVLMTQIKAQGDNTKVSINDPITRFAAQTAINHAAGMLASNGANPQEVAAKILARLPADMVAVVPASSATKTSPTA